MAQEIERIPLDEFLRHVAESLERARRATEGVVLEDQGNSYRIIYEGEATDIAADDSTQDPFLALSGTFESVGPTDVANHKHDYLADASEEQRTP